MNRLGRGWAVAALVLGAVLGVPLPAAHASAYRYWSYWHANPGASSWVFAGTGPTYRPSNGAVEGWRFAVSPDTANAPTPRANPATTYASACKGVTAPSGDKLVTLILDYGTAADAPSGEKPPHDALVATCVHVATNGTGFDVLAAAGVSVRQRDGLVCGLNGYPKTECAPAVKPSPTAKPSATPSKSTSSDAPSKSATHSPSATHSASPTPSATHASAVRSSAGPAHSRSATPSPRSTSPPSTTALAAGAPPSASTAAPTTAADATPSLVVGDVAGHAGHGSPWPLVGGIAVLVALLGGAGLQVRRRR
jgi:hypothetical protein